MKLSNCVCIVIVVVFMLFLLLLLLSVYTDLLVAVANVTPHCLFLFDCVAIHATMLLSLLSCTYSGVLLPLLL